MVWRRRLVGGVGLMAVFAAVVACSAGSKPASTTGASASSGQSAGGSSSAHPTGSPIRVGLVCTCSGAGGFGAFLLPAEDMYEAWANSVNGAGGISGHPVQVIAEDDGGTPGTAMSDIQTLIADHVVAVADLSSVDQTFATALQQADIPAVGVLTSETPFGTNPDFYPEAQTSDSAIYAVLTTAKAAGATNLANVYCAEAVICAESISGFQARGKQLGIPVVSNTEVSATAPNYATQCLAAKQQHVTSMFIGESSVTYMRIANDCAQQGFDPVYVQEGAGYSPNESSAPALKNSLWVLFPALPLFANTSAVQAANAALDKYFPGVRQNTTLYGQDPFMAWASGMLLEDAIKAGGLTASGAPTAAEVVSGLGSLKGDTVNGLTPPLTFTAGKAHTVDCWFTAQLKDGEPTLDNDGNVSCEPGSWS